MAKQLTNRLTALGRAHDLVRPLPGHARTDALLGDLISVLLSPYDDLGAFSGRIRVSVPRMGVGEASATTLALIIHELATNSLKYGALSSETGTLDVSSTGHDDDVIVTWTESGGPPVTSPTGQGRFWQQTHQPCNVNATGRHHHVRLGRRWSGRHFEDEQITA